MRKLIAIAALLFAATSAFAIDWNFNIKDNNAGTSRQVKVNGGAFDVDFPTLGENESLTSINVVDYNGLMNGTSAWLTDTLPAGEETAFNFRFGGLSDLVLQDLEDNMTLVIGYDDNDFMGQDGSATISSALGNLTRVGDVFSAAFTPEFDTKGIHFLTFNVGSVNNGTGLTAEDIADATVAEAYTGEPVFPETDSEVPEPATCAYALMGLGSLMGIKRRIGK